MSSRCARDLAPARVPATAHRRLADLDRLRAVWAEYRRRRRPGGPGDEVRAAVLRRHVRELRALAGQPETPEDRIRAEAGALAAMAAECRSGQPLTPDYISDLARRVPDISPFPAPELPEDADVVLADAAATETHPLVRAAHVHLVCGELLREAAPAETETDAGSGPPPFRHPLPWALASLCLLRADYPPLAVDRRIVEPPPVPPPQRDPDGQLAAVVQLFVALETASLREELSRPAEPGPAPPGSASLASALHRRILAHLRGRGDSLAMVLRSLDPDARTSITGGDVDHPDLRGQCDTAASRALFTRGLRCWWTTVDLHVTGARLRLLILVQEVGTPPTGVLAVTADARLTTPEGTTDVLDTACTDCVTLIPTDSAGERWPDVEGFVDDAVSRAVSRLTDAMR